MKQFKIFSLAILLSFVVTGLAFATGLSQVTSPKNYPTVWTEQVYNGSGSDIATQRVVEWDFDVSDSSINEFDDMCPWVQTTDATDDIWTAGVTLSNQGIANGETGTIIIKGPAVVYDGIGTSVCTVNTVVGGVSGGACADTTGASDDKTHLGIVIKTTATNQGYSSDALIYVDPTTEGDYN